MFSIILHTTLINSRNKTPLMDLHFSTIVMLNITWARKFTENITLSVPEDMVFNSSLQWLSLRSNSALTGSIPPQISKLNSLKILTLSQKYLSGEIPVEIFSLSSLLHLDLSYSLLSGTISNQLGNLKSLVRQSTTRS